MKKAILSLQILFLVSILADCFLYFSESGFIWLAFLVLFGLLTQCAAFVLQLIAYKRFKTKGAAHRIAVTAIIMFVMVLAVVQFYIFVF